MLKLSTVSSWNTFQTIQARCLCLPRRAAASISVGQGPFLGDTIHFTGEAPHKEVDKHVNYSYIPHKPQLTKLFSELSYSGRPQLAPSWWISCDSVVPIVCSSLSF